MYDPGARHRTCKDCGTYFALPTDHPGHTIRCPPCRDIHFNKKCIRCGATFRMRSNQTARKYCTPQCYQRGQRVSKEPIPCQHCETPFVPCRKERRFCSHECWMASAEWHLMRNTNTTNAVAAQPPEGFPRDRAPTGEFECTPLDAPDDHLDRLPDDPTPDEIKTRCLEIQAGWNAETLLRRTTRSERPLRVEVKLMRDYSKEA